MENKKIHLSFDNKTLMMNTIDVIHDADCTFKVIDEHTLKIRCVYRASDDAEEDTIKELYIHFRYKVLESYTIYDFSKDRGKFKGKIIDNGLASDLEKLYVQVFDYFYNKTDMVMKVCDLIPKGLGNTKYLKFCDVEYIDVYGVSL